ncbi:aromatic acid exporter family protein [Streptomyces sp. ODS05-4]|uniref:FUSC family protein n=1 Tax=Streptomyces sp. ODS05-4 TaxID=2944939 RepID=UPI0021092F90|nr:aromatic acid exporter family protein [Streptomyces sp. ODS05-4]
MTWAASCGSWLKRALRAPGHERNTALLVGKSALAATLAWWVAYDLLNAASPAFAPFSAVLIMNATIYRSVWQALRYTAAVTVGVAVQAAVGFVAGPDLFAFVLVAVIALCLGQWPALGEQRSQVATAAFFAFSTYVTATSTGERVSQLGQIIVLVLVGCGVGLAVNLCVAPPLRYRSAEHGLRALAAEVEALLDDMSDGLCTGDVDAERARQWRAAGESAQRAVGQARAGLSTAENSLPFNPRRLLPAHRGYLSFERYRQSVDALERAVYQLGSLTRSLGRWRETENTYTYAPALRAYADFAGSLRDIAHIVAALDSDTLAEQAEEMCRLASIAQEALDKVLSTAREDALPLSDASRPYGVLVVEAGRLMEEFQNTCDVLKDTADA